MKTQLVECCYNNQKEILQFLKFLIKKMSKNKQKKRSKRKCCWLLIAFVESKTSTKGK